MIFSHNIAFNVPWQVWEINMNKKNNHSVIKNLFYLVNPVLEKS